MNKFTPPFTQYHSNESATVNGKKVKGWVMYNAAEVDPLITDMYEELLNVLKQAEANPFLSVGMLLEHHSKIKEVLATVTDGRGNDDSQ